MEPHDFRPFEDNQFHQVHLTPALPGLGLRLGLVLGLGLGLDCWTQVIGVIGLAAVLCIQIGYLRSIKVMLVLYEVGLD